MKTSIPCIALLSAFPALSYGIINIDFSNVTNTQNLMTGNSVSANTEILVFEDIATGLDLRIEALTAYTAANFNNNGDFGDFGQINLLGGETATFLFSLVEANTTNLATIDEVAFSFLDLDGADPLPYESVSINQSALLVLDKNTDLNLTVAGGVTTLDASTAAGAENNPTTTSLDAGQSAIAASFIFSNTNQFEFTFTSGPTDGGANTTGRNVLFAGDVTFDDPADPILVPEPSQLPLLLGLSALVCLGLRRRR